MLQGSVQENDVNYVTLLTEMDNKGFAAVFTYIDDETSSMEASITDNFVETNHAIQDHIAIKPRIYRLKGCVGEVIYKALPPYIETTYTTDTNVAFADPILQESLEKEQSIPDISGESTGAINQAVQNQIQSDKQEIKSYRTYVNTVTNDSSSMWLDSKRQEHTVAFLNRVLELRQPVNLKGLRFEESLDTGNKYQRIFYLQSVTAHQGTSNFISDIEVTIKEFRIATTLTTQLDPTKLGGYTNTASSQKQPEQNQGTATGETVSQQNEDKVKETVKEALKDHPFVYKVTAGAYHALQNVGETFNKQSQVWGHK